MRLLEVSGKELAELRDQLDDKTIERNELMLRQEVKDVYKRSMTSTKKLFSAWRSNWQMPMRKLSGLRSMQKTKNWPINGRLRDCTVSMTKWSSNGGTTISNWRS